MQSLLPKLPTLQKPVLTPILARARGSRCARAIVQAWKDPQERVRELEDHCKTLEHPLSKSASVQPFLLQEARASKLARKPTVQPALLSKLVIVPVIVINSVVPGVIVFGNTTLPE